MKVTMETVKVNGPDVRGSAESIIEGIHQMFIEGGFDAARPCASLAVRFVSHDFHPEVQLITVYLTAT